MIIANIIALTIIGWFINALGFIWMTGIKPLSRPKRIVAFLTAPIPFITVPLAAFYQGLNWIDPPKKSTPNQIDLSKERALAEREVDELLDEQRDYYLADVHDNGFTLLGRTERKH